MDDSDQDFTDLCSKLLKRVRKKPAESRQAKKAEQQPSSQTHGDKSRKHNRTNGDGGSKCAGTRSVSNVAEAGQPVILRGQDSGDCGALGVPEASVELKQAEREMVAKDVVLLKMQQFKRADPKRMVPESQTTTQESSCDPPGPSGQSGEVQESFSPDMPSEPQDSDEALALRLQQELDREAAESQTVDLEEGGLFFCQICQRDLSWMTPEGRAQHLNRCLDESEQSAPAPPPPQPPPPPPPGVPDCPICGKKFKSQKSRSAHLKRCSSDLGVPPAVLMQAIQRQAEETQNAPSANTLIQTGGTKRKGPSKPGLPARKKPRKKTEPLDEDTMVALALSSSLLEQETKKNRETKSERQTETAASNTSVLKRRPDTGRGRGKKKVAAPRPPQLLLVQDAETALTRLQERVSALLLCSRPPSPPTPTFSPSGLPGWSGAAPLWQMSKLLDEGSTCPSDFYTPELREFITPWESGATVTASSSSVNNLESPKRRATEGTPLTGSRASTLPSCSRTPASTPGTGQLSVGSQALRDLMELADDGMTLTQCGFTSSGSNGKSVGQTTNLPLSGFVPEESEEQADLCVSGFLPDTTHTHNQSRKTTSQSRADKEQSVAISRLSSDLSSMVNNPQLSDVQLQVDSGDVFFAHSFMLYSRCPLLAEMIHESGFGVREEGLPAAQRVLISDVPGQAVLVLLQYLYTAHCSIPASLLPDVLELASRFDLQELQQLCRLHREDSLTEGEEEDHTSQENINNQTDQALEELLRSMWNEEEEGTDTDVNNEGEMEEDLQADGLTAAEVEIHEEKVNEEEMEEIYEFAATQRKREDKEDSVEEEEVFTKLIEPRSTSTDLSVKKLNQTSPLKPDVSLDRSYSRLFSQSWGVYKEGDPSSATEDPLSQQHKSPLKPTFNLSGRALLQSSGSVIEENSLSPPPSSSILPVTGQSPGLVEPQVAESSPLKQQSQGFQSICAPVSPHVSLTKKEPELIVLSDSSEEIEDVTCPCSPSPSSHTQNKTHPAQASNSTTEVRKSSSLEQSLGDLSPAPAQSYPAECSPEVSWLIPSTPLQHIQSTASSSTQTRSSMCRTRLFSKHDVSSSSVFSSPALPSKNNATRVSTLAGPTEGSIPLVKLEEDDPSSSDFDLNFCSKQTSGCVLNKDRDYFAVPNSQSKALHPSVLTSSKQETPLHPHANIQPHSSTPLHTELHLPPAYPATSPLHCDANKQRSTSKEREKEPLESPEKTELGSFHLSPLSDPSDPSSSSTGGPQSSQKHSNTSSHQRRHSVESDSHSNIERKGEMEWEIEDKSNNQEQGGAKSETQDADLSYQQSFMDMDEPPIAFNDSWGLDACGDTNPGRFSLRLEESRGSSKQNDSPEQRNTARSSSSADSQPSPAALRVQSPKNHSGVSNFSPSKAHSTRPQDPSTPEMNSVLDSEIWNSWKEEEDKEEEEVALPLSQRLKPSAKLKTPAATSHNKRRRSLVPITPMPHYSDMDTPELKNKLNRFGVRPLPKRQMILKLKEIHQYTHQLASSDSDSDSPCVGRAAQVKPQHASTVSARHRPTSCAQTVRFKEPRAPETSHLKNNREELLSASQGSNASSTAEESERSNPELCISSEGDSDSDGGISASQVASRLQDRLQAVRSFILSDSMLYTQILQYQPLVLSQLQQRLKEAGIRLGAAKLVDYLDSQCITFTTAKPGHAAQSRRRVKKTKGAGDGVGGRKKVVSAML